MKASQFGSTRNNMGVYNGAGKEMDKSNEGLWETENI